MHGPSRTVYPRAYGGTAAGGGLSPRYGGGGSGDVRSIPARTGEPRQVETRSIPARTGEPSGRQRSIPARTGEPLWRGGDAERTTRGLSPRVRGNPRWNGLAHTAGTGLSPRVRGNPIQESRRIRVDRGLSPRVRGNRFRLSPAYGGRLTAQLTVYPRAYGGTRP